MLGLLADYSPDQVGSVQQDSRSLRLSQALIPKEWKKGPCFAWATEYEVKSALAFFHGKTTNPSCLTSQSVTTSVARGRVGAEV